jgi:hypothetical protein
MLYCSQSYAIKSSDDNKVRVVMVFFFKLFIEQFVSRADSPKNLYGTVPHQMKKKTAVSLDEQSSQDHRLKKLWT